MRSKEGGKFRTNAYVHASGFIVPRYCSNIPHHQFVRLTRLHEAELLVTRNIVITSDQQNKYSNVDLFSFVQNTLQQPFVSQ